MRIWQEEIDAKVTYAQPWDGFVSSLVDRKVDWSFETWKTDWSWMAGYFSFGSWSGILLGEGPRMLDKQKVADEKKRK